MEEIGTQMTEQLKIENRTYNEIRKLGMTKTKIIEGSCIENQINILEYQDDDEIHQLERNHINLMLTVGFNAMEINEARYYRPNNIEEAAAVVTNKNIHHAENELTIRINNYSISIWYIDMKRIIKLLNRQNSVQTTFQVASYMHMYEYEDRLYQNMGILGERILFTKHNAEEMRLCNDITKRIVVTNDHTVKSWRYKSKDNSEIIISEKITTNKIQLIELIQQNQRRHFIVNDNERQINYIEVFDTNKGIIDYIKDPRMWYELSILIFINIVVAIIILLAVLLCTNNTELAMKIVITPLIIAPMAIILDVKRIASMLIRSETEDILKQYLK